MIKHILLAMLVSKCYYQFANSYEQSMSRPRPVQGLPHSQPPQQPQAPRQVPPGYPQQPQFQGFYPHYGQRYPPVFPPGPGFPPYGFPPGWYPPGQGFPQAPGFPPPQMPFGPPGQHQIPPQPRPGAPGAGPVNLPKPTSELPVGDKAASKPASQSATPAPAAAATATQNAPTPPVESKPSVTEAVQASTAAPAASTAIPSKVPPTGPRSDRVEPAIPISQPTRPAVPAVAPPMAGAPGNNVPPGNAQAAVTEATRAATAAVAAAMAKLPQPHAQKKPDASVENMTKQMNELKTHDGSRPQRGGHQPRGGRGGRGQYLNQGGKKFEVPETDYDFETANARFNKQDFLREAGAPEAENVPQEGEPQQPEPDTNGGSSVFSYNKTSSFFDNISSEARDREEGTGARAVGREWRGEEEKRNIETFGQGSVDGYRGRGRGRGRGYGRGRGGYGRGYSRGRGGFRGGRGASQSTGVPAPT